MRKYVGIFELDRIRSGKAPLKEVMKWSLFRKSPAKTANKTSAGWTDRPAPLVPGLCSLQAVADRAGKPDITVYRKDPRSAERWMRVLAGRGGFTCFLMRVSPDRWDVYGGDGKLILKGSAVTGSQVPECSHVVPVDRARLRQEVRETLFNPQLHLIVCSEAHAGASAADHSNFAIITYRMILEARPEDLEHVFLVDSRLFPCQTTAILADVPRLSPEMQDIYLDRYKWLENGWPLTPSHHLEMLAQRLGKFRWGFVMQLMMDCGKAAGMSPDQISDVQSRWTLASLEAKIRFAQHLVQRLREGLLFGPRAGEVFDDEIISSHGTEVMASCRDFLG